MENHHFLMGSTISIGNLAIWQSQSARFSSPGPSQYIVAGRAAARGWHI